MRRILDRARHRPHLRRPSVDGRAVLRREGAGELPRLEDAATTRFYDTIAPHLHDEGVLCEPDSREPWFVSAAHDASCLADTLKGFEQAVDRTIGKAAQAAVA